jgi:deoxyhypusine synthase
MLEQTVTAYLDVTVALPLLSAYVLQTTRPKKLKRLYERGPELRRKLVESYFRNNREVKSLQKEMQTLPPPEGGDLP